MGETGTAMSALQPTGSVLVQGEIWRAVASQPVAKGGRIRVVGLKELTLAVEPDPDEGQGA